MKPATALKISALPALLSLFLWLPTLSPGDFPTTDSSVVKEVQGSGSGWSKGPAQKKGPMVPVVGIICSLAIHVTLRFQESLQEHARTC
ncbi:hypothetical protein CBD41_01430 [bacterium TMED181]|nr:hypothetical protein [Planctomycetota bacterium]OUW47125.1 MAG: hypothetical protein CBD41_01430 [bacterium TMED181]